MRDILATEGRFELDVEPGAERAAWPWGRPPIANG
jgi:hypothetical protein